MKIGLELTSIGFHVQFTRELEVIVELDGAFTLPVVVKPLQLNRQDPRQLLDAHPLNRVNLLVALFAVVRVGSLELLPLDVVLQRIVYVAVVPDVDDQDGEAGFARVAMGAALADYLVRVRAAEDFGHHLVLIQRLERLVQRLDERVVELDSVVLFPQVHRLSVDSENVHVRSPVKNLVKI